MQWPPLPGYILQLPASVGPRQEKPTQLIPSGISVEYLRLFRPTVGLAPSLTSEGNLHRSFNFPQGKSMLLFYKEMMRQPQISWAESRFLCLPRALRPSSFSSGQEFPSASLPLSSSPATLALPPSPPSGVQCPAYHLP